MTIEISWWMLSPLTAICLIALAYQQGGSYSRGLETCISLLMVLTLIFSARFLP